MDQHDVLLALIDDVYAAPGTQSGWEAFLRHSCDALHGSGASLVAHNVVPFQLTIQTTGTPNLPTGSTTCAT